MKKFLLQAAKSFSFNKGTSEIARQHLPFLNKWGFRNFYYVRITRKGELVYLTNHVDFAMDYWEAGLPLRTGFEESQNGVLSNVIQWENTLEKEILDFAGLKNCFNGFSFVNRFYDKIQFASFLHSSPVQDPNNFYLKHIATLQMWLREFEWNNRKLIRQAEEDPIHLPQEYLMPQRGAFCSERTVELNYKDIRSKISFRELDCLHLYTKGFTTPHIATLLGLSPRTIETHLEAIKNRFGLESRDALATFAYANPLVQTYSPRLL